MNNISLSNEQIIALHRAACRDSLSEFLKASMHYVVPHESYQHNWHVDAICEFLTEIYKGNIRRGIINMPPRMLKSVCASIVFPAWILGKDPKKQILHATYNDVLSTDMSNATRQLMRTDFYRNLFPDTIISDHQDQKHLFETTQGGRRFATSFDSKATGFGGNFLIADDPISSGDANSPTIRNKCIEWYTGTLISRLNNRNTDSIFVVMQRLHIADLSAHLESEGGYEILKLPIYFKHHQVLTIGNFTKEIDENSYLFESRFGKKVVDELSKQHIFEAQYMQNPMLSGGSEIDISLIQYHDGDLRYKQMNIGIFVDPANSKRKEADYTAMMVVGLNTDGNYYLLEIVRDKLDIYERRNKIMELVRKWKLLGGKMPKVGIERYGMMVEIDIVKEYQKEQNFRFPITELSGKMSKEDRIRQLIPDLKDQKWYFPKQQYYTQLNGERVDLVKELVKKEIATFPGGIHPDMLDALARVKDPSITAILKFPKDNITVVDIFDKKYRNIEKIKSKHWRDL